MQYARQQRKWQDEDKGSQLDRNFDAIRALLCTKENIDGGFGIWDAGTSLSAPNVTGPHVLRTKYGIPMARPRGYKVLVPVFCILTCLQRAPINTIIRIVVSELRKFQHLDLLRVAMTIN